jgi:methanogenic corrinoid protein MtbC1
MGQRRENDCQQAREEKVGELGRAYAAAVLAGDEVAAEHVIREAIEADLSIVEVDEEIIAPALWLVGELWERGEISVADEHVATEISIRVLALEREARRVARVRPAYLAMLAAPPGELHVVALRMVAGVLREAGYEVMLVGADVPAVALAATAARHRPDVVCLSATMPGSGDQLMITMEEVQRAWPNVNFVIGGRALTSRFQAQPGVEICQRVSEAVGAVDALVQSARMN